MPVDDIDVVARTQVLRHMHPPYTGTGLANIGIASVIPGTVVYDALRETARAGGGLRIGHPSGVAVINVEATGTGTD